MDLQSGFAGRDRQPLISELSDDVKRLAWWLFQREPDLVGLHRALDLGTDVRCRFEEAIRGDQPIECLVRPLKVVVADEVLESVLCVGDVRKHRSPQKLVP